MKNNYNNNPANSYKRLLGDFAGIKTESEMSDKKFMQYGEEWKSEMKKLPKDVIINICSQMGIEKQKKIDKYEIALQQIATGEIVGQPNNIKDTLFICRDIAKIAIESE